MHKRYSIYISVSLCLFLWTAFPGKVAADETVFFKENGESSNLVVFVHGFTGHHKDTWTSEEGFFWPEYFAKDIELKDTDIYSFGYDTGCGYTLNIREIAGQLDIVITELNRQKQYDSVSFVAHSMGGLIVRQYILDRFTEMKFGTVILLATPNLGNAFGLRSVDWRV